jgi:hypothetical protein
MRTEWGFADVELASRSTKRSHIFLDVSSFKPLLKISLLLASFLAIHVIAAFRTSDFVAHKYEFFPIGHRPGPCSYRINISLTGLDPSQRYFALAASLLRNDTDTARQLPVDITHSLDANTAHRRANAAFLLGEPKSASFPILGFPILDRGPLNLSIVATANYSQIKGFDLDLSSFNSATTTHLQRSSLFLSLFMAYVTFIYLAYFPKSSEMWTQVYLLVLGCLGVFATNPLGHFLHSSPDLRLVDAALSALFVAVFRLFLITQLDLLSRQTVSLTLFIVLVFFLAVHATIDAAALFEPNDQSFAKFRNEDCRMCLDVVYVAISIVSWVLAVSGHDEHNGRRIALFGVAVLFTDCVTVFGHVWTPVSPAAMQMLYLPVHLTVAGAIVFLMSGAEGEEYVDMKKGPVPFVLDLEQDSDALVVDGEEDEDDNKEEEE